MSDALALIPTAPAPLALAEAEPRLAAIIEAEDDAAVLWDARQKFAALRGYYQRNSADADAAARLEILTEARIGALPEAAPKPAGRKPKNGNGALPIPKSESMALSRARKLAKAREDEPEAFAKVMAEPRPSRAKVLQATGEAAWDGIVERIVSPETRRLAAIDGWIAAALSAAEAFDAIDPPPTAAEAGPAAPAIQSMLRRLRRDANGMEVVK